MPEDEYVWLPRASLLSFEEIDRLVGVFVGVGVTRLRLTGGEPLLRHDLPTLVEALAERGLEDLAMTTNGVLLSQHAEALRVAGLGRTTVSLDTLRPERFAAFARRERLESVREGLDALRRAGFTRTKINTVVVRGFNDDELYDLFEFATGVGATIRFIEYMDVGGATAWSMDQVVSREDILQRFRTRYGAVHEVAPEHPNAPASRFRLDDGRLFGIVASTTAPFCAACDRARVTADGTLFLCLYADAGMDLRGPLREGASDVELAALIADYWKARRDRGAEARLADPNRGVLHQVARLRSDPRREMHTRGG